MVLGRLRKLSVMLRVWGKLLHCRQGITGSPIPNLKSATTQHVPALSPTSTADIIVVAAAISSAICIQSTPFPSTKTPITTLKATAHELVTTAGWTTGAGVLPGAVEVTARPLTMHLPPLQSIALLGNPAKELLEHFLEEGQRVWRKVCRGIGIGVPSNTTHL